MDEIEQDDKKIPLVLSEEINRIDYARSYDMTNLEINLFYNQKQHNLDKLIEQDYVNLIYSIRDSLSNIRRNKTKIKNLRAQLSVPEIYVKKMLKDIYDKSTSNIRSLKITLKKTNQYILDLENQIKVSKKNNESLIADEIINILQTHLYFFRCRKIYYEGAIKEYQKAVDYFKNKDEMRKNDKQAFKDFCETYVKNFLSMVDVEENLELEREKNLSARLDNVKKSLDFYRNSISKHFR